MCRQCSCTASFCSRATSSFSRRAAGAACAVSFAFALLVAQIVPVNLSVLTKQKLSHFQLQLSIFLFFFSSTSTARATRHLFTVRGLNRPRVRPPRPRIINFLLPSLPSPPPRPRCAPAPSSPSSSRRPCSTNSDKTQTAPLTNRSVSHASFQPLCTPRAAASFLLSCILQAFE